MSQPAWMLDPMVRQVLVELAALPEGIDDGSPRDAFFRLLDELTAASVAVRATALAAIMRSTNDVG